MFNICIIKPKDYIHYQAFTEIAELIHFSLLNLNCKSSITFNHLDTNPEKKKIIFGGHLLNNDLINKVPNNSIVFNTEQIESNTEEWRERIIKLANRNIELWDYSLFNIKFTQDKTNIKAKLFEIGYQRELNRITHKKTKKVDVLFYGSINDRRKIIIDKLIEKNIKVKCLFGVYGKDRDDWIAKSKLVLNMHMYDSKIFEIIRVFYLMTNGVPVVAEYDDKTKINNNFLMGIKTAPYNDLVEMIVHLVNSEKEREKLGHNGLLEIKKYPQEQFTKKILNL